MYVESQKTGQPYLCPKCDGTGRVDPPYIRLPRTYIFGNGSQIVLSGGNPGAQQDAQLIVSGKYAFEVVKGVATSTGSFQDQIFDQSTRGWQAAGIWMNNANRWGSGQLPFNYEATLILESQETLSASFRDTSNAQNTIQPCLCGYDLHDDSPSDLE